MFWHCWVEKRSPTKQTVIIWRKNNNNIVDLGLWTTPVLGHWFCYVSLCTNFSFIFIVFIVFGIGMDASEKRLNAVSWWNWLRSLAPLLCQILNKISKFGQLAAAQIITINCTLANMLHSERPELNKPENVYFFLLAALNFQKNL